jgi:hypothetical protein
MGLAERGVKTPKKSSFELWLDSLTDSNRQVVQGWLMDTEYTNADIMRMIRDDDPEDDFKGYRAAKDTISIWRSENGAR